MEGRGTHQPLTAFAADQDVQMMEWHPLQARVAAGNGSRMLDYTIRVLTP